MFATDVVKRQISPVFETIEGVAGVAVFGELDRNIRIWLDGDALRARQLSAVDVLNALRREHVEVPAGEVESGRVQWAVTTAGEFRTLEDLRGIP